MEDRIFSSYMKQSEVAEYYEKASAWPDEHPEFSEYLFQVF